MDETCNSFRTSKAHWKKFIPQLKRYVCGFLNAVGSDGPFNIKIQLSATDQEREKTMKDIATQLTKELIDGVDSVESLHERAPQLGPQGPMCMFVEEDCIVFQVRPLPLGKVQLLHRPVTRNLSHRADVRSCDDWIRRLGSIPFSKFNMTSPKMDKIIYTTGRPYERGERLEIKEHRWRAFKLPECLDRIDDCTVLSYFEDTFADCLFAVPEGERAELWIGIRDDGTVVGLPEARNSAIEVAIDNWLRSLLPLVTTDMIELTRHSVTFPSDEAFKTAILPQDSCKLLMRLLSGCSAIGLGSTEEDNAELLVSKFLLDGVKEFVDFCTSTPATATSSEFGDYVLSPIVATTLNFIMTCSEIRPSPKTEIDAAKYLLDMLSPYSWGKPTDESIIPRFVYCISIGLPRECCGVVVDSRFEFGNVYNFEARRHIPMQAMKIWLRAKGLSGGALASGLYSPLLSSNCRKVLITSPAKRERVLHSLVKYLDGYSPL